MLCSPTGAITWSEQSVQTIQSAPRKAAIDDSVRKFSLKGQLHKCSNEMLHRAPDCSFYFTEQKAQSSLQELQMQPVLKQERKRNLMVQHRKICQTSGCSQREPSNAFRQETGLRGEIVCQGEISLLQMKLGQCYKTIRYWKDKATFI